MTCITFWVEQLRDVLTIHNVLDFVLSLLACFPTRKIRSCFVILGIYTRWRILESHLPYFGLGCSLKFHFPGTGITLPCTNMFEYDLRQFLSRNIAERWVVVQWWTIGKKEYIQNRFSFCFLVRGCASISEMKNYDWMVVNQMTRNGCRWKYMNGNRMGQRPEASGPNQILRPRTRGRPWSPSLARTIVSAIVEVL